MPHSPNLLAPFDLTGSTALITGGTSGIGRACAERFVSYGANVIVTCLENFEDPNRELEKFDGLQKVSVQAIDLSDTDSILRCFTSVTELHGKIDILVNNAGVGSATVTAQAADVSDQDTLMLKVNAEGTLKMCQHFLALPDAPGKKIINVSSVGGGITVFPDFRLSDGMSKSAIAFLTRQLAAETVHLNIDVFAVCPGATNTPMFDASTLSQMTNTEKDAFLKQLPKNRLIEPSEIAGIVHFLASPAARALHGAVIDASMGLGVRPGLMSEFKKLKDL